MQPKAINGNSLSVSLKMKQPYKSIGLSHIFSTKPACSLWFPIASHTGKTITNFILNNYIYKLSNLAARFNQKWISHLKTGQKNKVMSKHRKPILGHHKYVTPIIIHITYHKKSDRFSAIST